jgi:hypothetical protein
MNSHTEIMPIERPMANTATPKKRLLTVCFLTVTTVAVLGWWAALSWAVIAFAGSFF